MNGFAVIAVVLLIGYVAARINLLGASGGDVLNRLVFMIGFPALTFMVTTTNDLGAIFSGTGLVALTSAVAVMLIFLAAGLLFRWEAARSVVGALTAGLVNSSNLGFPLATYIFGSVAPVTSILLFQQILLNPIALIALEILTSRGKDQKLWRLILRPFQNPIIIAAILGITVNLCGLEIPDAVSQPIELLSRISIPIMLLVFGMSLRDFRLRITRPDRGPIILAVVLKSLAQPVIAWLLASVVFALPGDQIFVTVACACLPTAQNTLATAIRYRTAVSTASATAVITTVLTIPLLITTIVLFS